MSIYTECSEAAHQLLNGDELADPKGYAGIAGVFTELDAILLASGRGGWGGNEDAFRIAQREASNIMTHLFNTGQVVRYGPVEFPGLPMPDYVRVDSKILYAGPDGPQRIKTPNGTFEQISIERSLPSKPGRRLGANRSDLTLWADQDIFPRQASENEEILRLRAEVRDLQIALAALRNPQRRSVA